MAGRTVYAPKNWVTGETIAEAALDHIEQGIYDVDNEVTSARGNSNTLSDMLASKVIRSDITQSLTDSDKARARSNIGVVKISINGHTLVLN